MENVSRTSSRATILFDKYSDLIVAVVLVLIPVLYFTITIPDLSPVLRIIGFLVIPISIIGHFLLEFLHH